MIMNNQDLAEAFARGETRGRANSMFIELAGKCPVIYSYGHHFPIAMFGVTGKIVYFNTDKYSVTTARHKGHVRRALEAMEVFNVFIVESDTQKLTEMIHKKRLE